MLFIAIMGFVVFNKIKNYSLFLILMKIGILTHLSPSYPLLTSDFLVGLKISLPENCELEKVFLSANSLEREVLEEAQKLLIEEVDYLIAYTNVMNLVMLQDLVMKMGKAAVFIDSGSQPRIGFEYRKQVYWLSMQLMESAFQLSKKIGSKKDGRLVILSDFVNSGYQVSNQFAQLFEKDGGEICMQYVVPMQHDLESQLDHLANKIIKEAATHIYINAHGEEGSLFLSLSQRQDIRDKLPKLKWAIGNQLFQELDSSILNKKEEIYACSTWKDNSEYGNSFSKKFEKRTKRKPSIIASLAYEAGLLIDQIERGEIVDLKGPRGTLVWNEVQYYLQAPQQFYSIDKSGKNSVLQEEEYPVMEDKDAETASGWTNTYLCY